MERRNRSIDAIKGVAIVLVMLGHVFVHNHMEDPYVYDFIRAVQMPLFMIVSGYLCGRGRKISDPETYVGVMKKRAVSYLIPFFFWLTLKHWDHLRAAYERIFFELDFGLWFLAVLFLLTFMVCTAQLAASKFREKGKLLSEAVFWLTYGILCFIPIFQILSGNRFLSPTLTVLYIPFYMLGYVVGSYGKNFLCWGTKEAGKVDCKNSPVVRIGMGAAAVLFLYLIVTKNLNSMESRMDTLTQMLASLLGSAVIIYGILLLKDGRVKKFFAWLGLYTLEIYVVHYHFATVLNFQNLQYEFYTPQGVLFVLLSFAAMSILTFACIWLMKKVRILDFLFFGKR